MDMCFHKIHWLKKYSDLYRHSQKSYSYFIKILQAKGHFEYLNDGYALAHYNLICTSIFSQKFKKAYLSYKFYRVLKWHLFNKSSIWAYHEYFSSTNTIQDIIAVESYIGLIWIFQTFYKILIGYYIADWNAIWGMPLLNLFLV